MRAYRARYVSGNVVPLENYTIPEGSELILTVLDSDVSFNTLSRQQNALICNLKKQY